MHTTIKIRETATRTFILTLAEPVTVRGSNHIGAPRTEIATRAHIRQFWDGNAWDSAVSIYNRGRFTIHTGPDSSVQDLRDRLAAEYAPTHTPQIGATK